MTQITKHPPCTMTIMNEFFKLCYMSQKSSITAKYKNVKNKNLSPNTLTQSHMYFVDLKNFFNIQLLINLKSIITEGSHLYISSRESTAIMSRPSHFHFIVDVKPFRMVIHLLARHRHTTHPTPSLHKILEYKSLVNGITSIDHFPSRLQQRLQLGLPLALA